MCSRAPIVPFKTMAKAIITYPTAIAGRACFLHKNNLLSMDSHTDELYTHHPKPTANIELASSQAGTLQASEIQYVTNDIVDQVREDGGTGSISRLDHTHPLFEVGGA